ncbi:hypothetical protein ADEAN_000402000 [Angomonas deanei]|uniref:Uncharacterized protein n=1 Tax=Angomonas deanei TaxID=59799 RepID=A0A7G2C9V8_9TRYP|nr:hypothetical protein ADEAN_000402000 [Angomonas deanei]
MSVQCEMPTTREQSPSLEDQLLRREFHLAELIDEIVFAENERKSALERCEHATGRLGQVERLLRYLLQFQLTLVGEIIVPSLLESDVEENTLSHPRVRQSLRDLEHDTFLSSETRTLIGKVLSQSLKRESSNSVEDAPVSRAVRLASQLLRHQKDLLDDLDRLSYQALPHELSTGEVRSPSRPALEIQEQLYAIEKERNALRAQLHSVGENEKIIESLLSDKKQLERELVFAQEQTLNYQDKNRKLNQRVLELEDEVHRVKVKYRTVASPKELTSADAKSVSLVQSLRNELQQITHEAQLTKSRLESEVYRLDVENAALRGRQENAIRAAENPQINQLEAVVATLRTELQIMEGRVATIRNQRDVERRRILNLSETERQRLLRDREECRLLLSKMTNELNALEIENANSRGALSLRKM